jgi:hypothetical protein
MSNVLDRFYDAVRLNAALSGQQPDKFKNFHKQFKLALESLIDEGNLQFFNDIKASDNLGIANNTYIFFDHFCQTLARVGISKEDILSLPEILSQVLNSFDEVGKPNYNLILCASHGMFSIQIWDKAFMSHPTTEKEMKNLAGKLLGFGNSISGKDSFISKLVESEHASFFGKINSLFNILLENQSFNLENELDDTISVGVISYRLEMLNVQKALLNISSNSVTEG